MVLYTWNHVTAKFNSKKCMALDLCPNMSHDVWAFNEKRLIATFHDIPYNIYTENKSQRLCLIKVDQAWPSLLNYLVKAIILSPIDQP